MFDFLAIVGFIGFLIFIILAIISIIKKNGKAKKQFGIAGALFVLFMIGVLNSPTTEESTGDNDSKEVQDKEKAKRRKERG